MHFAGKTGIFRIPELASKTPEPIIVTCSHGHSFGSTGMYSRPAISPQAPPLNACLGNASSPNFVVLF